MQNYVGCGVKVLQAAQLPVSTTKAGAMGFEGEAE